MKPHDAASSTTIKSDIAAMTKSCLLGADISCSPHTTMMIDTAGYVAGAFPA
jgi:hypothetical protein